MKNKYLFNEKGFANNITTRNVDEYRKYIDYFRFKKSPKKVLDVGCGTGIVVDSLSEKYDSCGLDIGKKSLDFARKNRKGKYFHYEGREFPFDNNTFDTVGSFNVLEHTDNPNMFLQEKKRVLKKGGHMILVCPNFISITNDYHYRTKGLISKIRNLFLMASKLFSSFEGFSSMKPLKRKAFTPDSDAIVLTNPIDIIEWSKKNNMKLIYWSSSSVYRKGLVKIMDFGIFRLLLGSSFLIFKKK